MVGGGTGAAIVARRCAIVGRERCGSSRRREGRGGLWGLLRTGEN